VNIENNNPVIATAMEIFIAIESKRKKMSLSTTKKSIAMKEECSDNCIKIIEVKLPSQRETRRIWRINNIFLPDVFSMLSSLIL